MAYEYVANVMVSGNNGPKCSKCFTRHIIIIGNIVRL